MRASDRAELHACGHDDAQWVVAHSVAASLMCWSWFVDGELACIMGVAPLSILGGIGSPWMLGTPVCDRHARVLIKRPPEYIAEMLKAFPHLVNFVHAKNTTSVRWLKRLGFTLHEATPHGALGEAFHKFEMKV